jgi:pentatricopeptide repeat protein
MNSKKNNSDFVNYCSNFVVYASNAKRKFKFIDKTYDKLHTRNAMEHDSDSDSALAFTSRPLQASQMAKIKILKDTTNHISDLGRKGRSKEALNLLLDKIETGMQPDTPIITALLDACSKNPDVEIAQHVFENIFGGFNPLLVPDEQTFRALLKCHLRLHPPSWTAASWILQVAEIQFNCQPSSITYNCMLETCVRTNDLYRGEEIIDRMVALGIEPDQKTIECVKSRKAFRSQIKRIVGKIERLT